MFIRFVRNKKTAGRHRGPYFKGAAICLVLVIGISFLNTVVCRVTGADSLLQWVGECVSDGTGRAVMSLYCFVAEKEYNIAGYGDYVNASNDSDVATDIMNVINRQSNLYAYIDEEITEISLSYYDPSYTENEFSGKIVEEHGGDTEPETVTEPSTEEAASTVPAKEGYVIPAVSDSGITYSIDQLSNFDFLMSKLYIVPERAKVLESELVASEMLAKDMTLQGDNSKPQILIYHTHSQEGFVDSVQGDDSTTIVAVGTYLAEILSDVYGYNVIHCTEHFDIKGGSLDRSKSYTYAEYTVEQILEDNPSIEVVLDIHRDGLSEDADKLVTNINGKDTAKIMFFNGVSRSSATGDIDYLYNQYKKDNLAFSFQLKLTAMECYPEFTRRNYIDAYQYNLHMRPKSVLIEVGAQNNTLQEELNAMEVLAEVLHRVIQ